MPGSTLLPNTFWDDRQPGVGGQSYIVLNPPTKCAEDPIVGNRVFMSIARPENVEMTAIILCPQNYDTRNAADVDEQRLKSLANFEKIKFDNLYPIERITYRNSIFIFLTLLLQAPIGGQAPMGTPLHLSSQFSTEALSFNEPILICYSLPNNRTRYTPACCWPPTLRLGSYCIASPDRPGETT